MVVSPGVIQQPACWECGRRYQTHPTTIKGEEETHVPMSIDTKFGSWCEAYRGTSFQP